MSVTDFDKGAKGGLITNSE